MIDFFTFGEYLVLVQNYVYSRLLTLYERAKKYK